MVTDAQARAAKPKERDYKLGAGEGLYLLVCPNGRKYWKLKYRFAGKEKKLSLGVYPAVSLKEARTLVAEAKAKLRQDINPSEQKRTDKAAKRVAAESSFQAITDEWMATHLEDKSVSHQRRTRATLNNRLLPFLGKRPLSEITAPELLDVLRKAESAGRIDQAHRARQLFGQISKYAIQTGRIERDVAANLKGALKSVATKHYAALTEPADVGRLMLAIDGYRGTPIVMAALRISPLLMARPGIIRQMEWSEIDYEASTWIIPAEKMKEPRDHVVPLSTQALAILEDVRPFSMRSRYVFPSARGEGRCLSENTIRVALRTMGYTNDQMTPHGFRAMARTMLDEILGVRPDFLEHQLHHAVKDPNGRAYNRTQFLPDRADMMQRWADYLDELRLAADHNNVVVGAFKNRERQ